MGGKEKKENEGSKLDKSKIIRELTGRTEPLSPKDLKVLIELLNAAARNDLESVRKLYSGMSGSAKATAGIVMAMCGISTEK